MARTEVMHASEMSCSKLMILINDIYCMCKSIGQTVVHENTYPCHIFMIIPLNAQ